MATRSASCSVDAFCKAACQLVGNLLQTVGALGEENVHSRRRNARSLSMGTATSLSANKPDSSSSRRVSTPGVDENAVDSPALLNLSHGTIRYRQPGNHNPNVKTGYFYHAKLNDFTRVQPEDDYKLHYVFKGPKKDRNKKLFYVYGKGLGFDHHDNGLQTLPYRPQGKGYVWPKRYQGIVCDVRVPSDQIQLSDDSSREDTFQLDVRDSDLVRKIRERVSEKLLRPVDDIVLMSDERVLADGEKIGRLKPREIITWSEFVIEIETR